MRSACAQRCLQRRATRPALRGRTPRRRARAASTSCERAARRANWWPAAAPAAPPARRPRRPRPGCSAKCAPMPARSTLGDHSAAVPLSASTCAKPKAAALRRMVPTLPASCRRSSTTRGRVGRQRAGAPARHRRSRCAGGDSSVLSPAISACGTIATAVGLAGQRAQRRLLPAGSADDGLRRRAAALQRRPRTGDRPRATPRRACGRRRGRPPACAARTSSGLSRELMRRRRRPSLSRRPAPRAPARTSAGAAGRRRARAAPPGAPASGSPCGRRSRTAGAARAGPGTAGRGAPWRGWTRPRSPCTLASPLTMASAGTFSTGRRLPSTSTLAGFRRRPSTARRIASSVACRMLSASISSTLASAMQQHSALARISSNSVRASRGVSCLESVRPLIGLQLVEDHRRGHHRPGQRAAAGLVDAGHQAGPSKRRPSCSARKNLLDRIGGGAGGVAAQFAGAVSGSARRSAAQRCGSSSQASAACASCSRRRLALQQLGHREVAQQDVGQADPGLVASCASSSASSARACA